MLHTVNQQHTITRVLIVGAGPAGLGVAAALKRAGVIDLLVVDSREIGAAFRAWPAQMKLITPSFHSNSFGLTDLNSIDPETSPADFLRTQHPTGKQYAKYLKTVAAHFRLPVETGIEVTALEKTGAGFLATTNKGVIEAEYVVWTTGQFFTPRSHDFPGAHHALHSSRVSDWSTLNGEAFTVIGGYESGVDAALNLIDLGKSVRLISRGEPWSSDHPDPSRSLSPRTYDRLRELLQTPEKATRLEFVKNTTVHHIEKAADWWSLRDQDDFPHTSLTRPILANGFTGGLSQIANLFARDSHDRPTLTKNLFYSGPELVHRNSLFCFIYKFRARFGVIAHEIATRCGKPDIDEKLLPYLKAGLMNADLDCCTDCQCAIEPAATAAPQPAAFAN
jgi:cation diffusion facilitator CzcD-associated flavoprotein CzcO